MLHTEMFFYNNDQTSLNFAYPRKGLGDPAVSRRIT